MYETYSGWQRRGRNVAPGCRSSFRNEYGDPMFHYDCTVPIIRMRRFREVTTRVYY
jgi:hypothetical protein